MSKVSVVAKITAQAGKRDEVMAALGGLLASAQEEPGTLLYLFNSDGKDADVIWVYELYESQAALDAHSGSAAMKAAGPALGALLAGAP
jgi:quinol monooxygenase YgiN